MPALIDHKQLYRLPWNLADNPIVWLEPTEHCNLFCDGCYRKNTPKHKTLEEIDSDLDVFQRLRTFDSVSIAGGDPLTHPDVLEIVRRIKARGIKPIINTNGHALTPQLLRELKKAGVFGFTLHVDSKQGRPDWRGKDEIGMNELRTYYAEMIAREGNMSCSFNSTVYPDTIEQVPDIVDWAQRHIDKVQTVVFIIFRHADLSGGSWEYWAGSQKVQMETVVYAEKEKRNINIKAQDVVEVIRKRHPDFAPSAYLNGTESADSFKWLNSIRVGNAERIYGYGGPKWMEAVQVAHHFATGRYMAYTRPWVTSQGLGATVLGSTVDRGMRRIAANYARSIVRNPLEMMRKLYVQSVLIIQPIDIMPDGGQNMCDGCPDVTVHDGRLVWSCRLEEPRKFGTFVRTVPTVTKH